MHSAEFQRSSLWCESSKDKSASKKISSTWQNVSDLRLRADISLFLNHLLIKCQILPVFEARHTNVHDMRSTDDATRVLSHLKASKYSTPCYTKNKGGKKKPESKDRGHFLQPHWCVTWSHSFTSCVLARNMKAAWWVSAFYRISPGVIAVPSLLLKRCQSAWTKWQPSGNWITGRGGSQESPSSDLRAKWSGCVVMSRALGLLFPWRFFLKMFQKVLTSAWCRVISINVAVPCNHRNNVSY